MAAAAGRYVPQPRRGMAALDSDGLLSHSSLIAPLTLSQKVAAILPGPRESFKIVTDANLKLVDLVLREAGVGCVWKVSSSKHGNGVMQLRDNDPTTYWQSDGHQPHAITALLPALTKVLYVAVLLNFASDESYTPRKLVVRCGTHVLMDVATVDFDSPKGWVLIKLGGEEASATPSPPPPTAASPPVVAAPPWLSCGLHTLMIQIQVAENHQNGRDTHVRGVRLYTDVPAEEYQTAAFRTSCALR